LFLPTATPLIGMFCLGNLMKESGVVDRLSNSVQNELINVVTIFLGLAVGSKLSADKFLTVENLGVLALGAAGVPAVSAVPMAARVVNPIFRTHFKNKFSGIHHQGN
jgi:Na+-transporting methylmalonyl-CoA/oxaloacetate decarboxylase beta subunit